MRDLFSEFYDIAKKRVFSKQVFNYLAERFGAKFLRLLLFMRTVHLWWTLSQEISRPSLLIVPRWVYKHLGHAIEPSRPLIPTSSDFWH